MLTRLARWTLCAGLGAVALLPSAAPGSAKTPLMGLSDDLAFADSRAAPRALAFRTAREAGARLARITLDWARVAPAGAVKPAGFDASDPAHRAYNWGYIEDAVRDAARSRFRVLLTIRRAPAWAEGPGRPAGAPPGSWAPDPAELAAFVRAAARRFSGFYPDPKASSNGLREAGASLPGVRLWQIWAEPNGGETLRPVTGAARRYRRMLATSARALRRVSSRNVVVAAGTAVDGPIAPLNFWRALLCRSCAGQARFHVAALSVGGRSGELGLAQMVRLQRLLSGLGRDKPLWLTRVGWETPPLKRGGVSPARQARLLSEALFQADRARAEVVVWDGLQDRTSYLEGFQSIASGLFFNHHDDLTRDRAKPALRAFRFPFVVRPAKGAVVAWGVAPRSRAPVTVDRRDGATWRRVAAARASRSGEFVVRVSRNRGVLRASQGRAQSLPWRF